MCTENKDIWYCKTVGIILNLLVHLSHFVSPLCIVEKESSTVHVCRDQWVISSSTWLFFFFLSITHCFFWLNLLSLLIWYLIKRWEKIWKLKRCLCTSVFWFVCFSLFVFLTNHLTTSHIYSIWLPWLPGNILLSQRNISNNYLDGDYNGDYSTKNYFWK